MNYDLSPTIALLETVEAELIALRKERDEARATLADQQRAFVETVRVMELRVEQMRARGDALAKAADHYTDNDADAGSACWDLMSAVNAWRRHE